MDKEELKQRIVSEFNEQGINDVDVRFSAFLNIPWLYILFYHKGKGIIFDVSVETYERYKIAGIIGVLQNEWMKVHKEVW